MRGSQSSFTPEAVCQYALSVSARAGSIARSWQPVHFGQAGEALHKSEIFSLALATRDSNRYCSRFGVVSDIGGAVRHGIAMGFRIGDKGITTIERNV